MGHTRHHAIIVSGSYRYNYGLNSKKIDHRCHGMHWAAVARCKALELFDADNISELLHSGINGVKSFCVAPDGSKEGWDDSDKGDENRDIFIEWLESIRYDDLSSPLDWVEVQYGDDDMVTMVVRDSDEKLRDDNP